VINCRRYVFHLAAIAVSVLLYSAIAGGAASDSCRAKLPTSLVHAIKETFKGYRAPLESDNLAEDIDYNRAHGGDGCLGVAAGAFRGGSETDYVLGLTPVDGQPGRVVMAFPQKSGWTFKDLRDDSLVDRRRLYVRTTEPGRYEHTRAFDVAPNSGESEVMQCPNTAAVFGATGASATVYCYSGGTWLHTLVSD
jgi:hypothetical protein